MDLKHAFNDFVNQYVIEAEPESESLKAKQVDPNAIMYKQPVTPPLTATLPGNYGINGMATLPPPPTAEASVLAGQFMASLQAKIKTGSRYGVYSAFVSATESLAEFIPDEAQRFRAASKQLAVSNTRPSDIEGACEEMMGILIAETEKFGQIVQAQTATEVTQRAADVDGINTHIEQLKQQITTLTSQRDTIASDIVAHKQKIDAAQAGFDGAVAVIRKEADDFIKQLNTYTASAKNT